MHDTATPTSGPWWARRRVGLLAALCVAVGVAFAVADTGQMAGPVAVQQSTPQTRAPVPVTPAVTMQVAVATVAEVGVWRDRPQELVEGSADPAGEGRYRAGEPARSVLAAFTGPIPEPGRNVAGRIGEQWGWRFTSPASDGHLAVFPVVADHGSWLQVLLPVRPNGTVGWVRADQVRLEERRTHARIELGARRLSVLEGDTEVWSTPVAVGAAGTETPTGRFYVTGPVDSGDPGGPYGPVILGLSGFSESLDSFDGGAPGLAIHGTNRPALIGQAVSNGCVRVPNDALGALVFLLPAGTLVDVHP